MADELNDPGPPSVAAGDGGGSGRGGDGGGNGDDGGNGAGGGGWGGGERPGGLAARIGGRRHARWVLLGCVVAGVCFDAAGRADAVGVGVTVWLAALAAAVLAAAGPDRRRSAAALAAAVFFAAWVSVRASPWLLPLDVLASLGLLAVAASVTLERRVWSRSLVGWSAAGGRLVVGAVAAPLVAAQLCVASLPPFRHNARGAAWARGVVLAVPLLVVLGALLASADAVFASFFVIDADLGSLVSRTILVGMGALGAAGLVAPLLLAKAALPSAERPMTPVERPVMPRLLGVIEASVVLGGLVALYGLFAVSQLVTALAGDDYVRDRAGLTYAEHARSGFFQLLAVAALTLLVLGALRAVTRLEAGGRSTLVWRGLALAAVVLTEVIVASAVRRIGLYEEVYGHTMLRLTTTWFAWWLGAVFLLVGAAWAGVGAARRWLSIGICLLGGLWLGALNAVNPEARVARANLAGAGQAPIDIDYVATLSDDATGAIVERLGDPSGEGRPQLDAAERRRLLEVLCGGLVDGARELDSTRRPERQPDGDDGVWSFNLSRHRAADARERYCGAA